MNPEEYMSERVNPTIKWYSKKSSTNKVIFMSFKFTEITIAAVLPLLSGRISKDTTVGLTTFMPLIIGGIGVLISIIEGVLFVGKFQEKWVTYRSTAESLKHEKYLFLTQVIPYKTINDFDKFVVNIESLISRENSEGFKRIFSSTHAEKK
jgi:hypothetical protein